MSSLKKKSVKKQNARKIAADFARFNQSVNFDELPPLTPEYFFSFFEPIMKVLKLSITSERFKKDWVEHILPLQELARKQGKQGELVHKSSQGRPKTVMPLMETVTMPTELLHDKSLLVVPAGNDAPIHMNFPKKRKTKRPDKYGHYNYFYFSSFVVIVGFQIRSTIIDKYGFDETETEVMNRLVKQYDKKLEDEIKLSKRKAAEEASKYTQQADAIPSDWDNNGASSDDDSESDDEEKEEMHKRKRKRKQEKEQEDEDEQEDEEEEEKEDKEDFDVYMRKLIEEKKKKKERKEKLKEGGLSSCTALGVVFEDHTPKHPFAHVHSFTRDKELFEYIISCLRGENANDVRVSGVF